LIAVDTNILVYAHRAETPWHKAAKAAVKQCAEGRAQWAIPWPCVHEFLGVVTHPRVFKPATPLDLAYAQVESWLQSPSAKVLAETDDHWAVLKRLATAARIAGPAIHDARIAAICLQHGVAELWSADRDFSRYPALNVRNPLV
jgi:hypothetical protein